MSTEPIGTSQVNLSSSVPLDNRAAIYVPVRLGLQDIIMVMLTRVTGGATAIRAVGSWLNRNGLVQQEDVDIIYSYYTSEKKIAARICLFECVSLLLDAHEEAAMIEYAGKAEVIS